jgi:hypothetical protein
MNSIFTNVGDPKKFWEEFPIHIILDEQERQRRREHREQLQISIDYPQRIPDRTSEEEEDQDIIIIKLA